ncbi:MAG: type II toxin-antitoxin system PemK/MazF family toxin [Anaerotignum sp.]|nr:type II toxin-antitoxin system PemK/MazF family toxin [Anaerotignum sp.]
MKNGILFTKKFNVYEADLSDIGLGVSPCIIIQNDVGNKYCPTTIIMPLMHKKEEKGCLYFKVRLKNLGDMYVLASYVKCIDKRRLTTNQPIDVIEDSETKTKLTQFYFANAGMKVQFVNGKRKIVDMTDSELDFLYKESEEC